MMMLCRGRLHQLLSRRLHQLLLRGSGTRDNPLFWKTKYEELAIISTSTRSLTPSFNPVRARLLLSTALLREISGLEPHGYEPLNILLPATSKYQDGA